MKRLIETKFFVLLKQNKNIPEQEYEKFAYLLFAEKEGMDKEQYRNSLVYTRIELSSLAEVSKKK